MPNLPAEILKGVTAFKENGRVEEEQSKEFGFIIRGFWRNCKIC